METVALKHAYDRAASQKACSCAALDRFENPKYPLPPNNPLQVHVIFVHNLTSVYTNNCL